jgi:uncharacterized membrane protein/thiol-disulfide isomerase/thioredoxin
MKTIKTHLTLLWRSFLLLSLLLSLGLPNPARAQSEQPVVHAVMFWSETCGHCQYVLEEVLPPLQSQYGEQLDIRLVELQSAQDYDRLYQVAEVMGVEKSAVGVPYMVVGEQALIGYLQIPDELPGLVEEYLALDGIAVPEWLDEMLPTSSEDPVYIYLFWGDGCPHCEEARPALQALAQRYPDVEVREYEVWYNAENHTYYTGMAAALGFEAKYVPTIIIGEQYWEGYAEGLLPEMEAALTACLETGCPDMGAGIVPDGSTSAADAATAPVTPALMQSDGFTLAIFVLLGMAAAVVYSGVYLGLGLRRPIKPRKSFPRKHRAAREAAWERWRNAGMLALCLVGLGVAGYLAYVETQAVEAVCGPVGDCNTVQSSPYALLFGILPIGVLGVIGYLLILAAWAYPQFQRNRLAVYMPLAVFGMALFGVFFSLYLTYLEPFVIQAVCMWCVTSAVIMTLLLLLSLKPALAAFQNLREMNKLHVKTEIETTSS